MNRNNLRVYLVTDRRLCNGRSLVDIVIQAVKGGVTMVQLREKDIDTRGFIQEAIQLKNALEGLAVPLIINDRVDVALASGADGVHIGQSDMPYDMARQLLGPEKIIGLSVENMQQLEQANSLNVDYIGISPVFSTPTKTDAAPPWGIDAVKEAVRRSAHPTVAIGGMNAATVGQVIASGCDGVAVVSAIMAAPSPRIAAEELSAIINNAKAR